MNYELLYARRAIKDIHRLDPETKERIGKALLRFSKDPLKFAEKLTDSELGTYRFRIGDYSREIYKRK